VAFAWGTAADIPPISEIWSPSFGIRWPVGDDRVSLSLRDELTGIQYGRIDDRHGWLRRLDG
jgi:branched-chain amino acid aminotransferase